MDEHEEIIENENIFEQLKNIRIKKNLDLAKISEKTKISLKYLEAIESGNIKDIPEVYDKLFFQTYLNSLNIKKTEEYIEEFYKIRKEVRPQYTTTIQKIKSMKSDSRRFSKLKQLYLIVPILIVVVLIIFFAIISKSVNKNIVEDIPELSVRDVAKELEKKNIDPIDSAAVQQKKSKLINSNNVTVDIITKELTWLRLVKDKTDTSEYLLNPGNRISEKADSTINLLVGNAGGVSFKVNGKDIGILGHSSEIITNFKITSKGIESKQIKAISKEQMVDSLINN
jgi:cytoskeletal protein RodZ